MTATATTATTLIAERLEARVKALSRRDQEVLGKISRLGRQIEALGGGHSLEAEEVWEDFLRMAEDRDHYKEGFYTNM